MPCPPDAAPPDGAGSGAATPSAPRRASGGHVLAVRRLGILAALPPSARVPLTAHEVALLLGGVRVATVRRLVQQGVLPEPSLRVGKSPRWWREEILAALATRDDWEAQPRLPKRAPGASLLP